VGAVVGGEEGVGMEAGEVEGVGSFSGKNLGMIGHFFGWVRQKIAQSAISKCGVSRDFFKT